MNWRIDFPNEGSVLSYIAYPGNCKLTTYYDVYCQCHRYTLERLVRIGQKTTRWLVRDTSHAPVAGWNNADEAKRAAKNYFMAWLREQVQA